MGVDINMSDYDGRTALHLAAAENQPEIIKLICRQDNVILKPDINEETPIFDAIRAESFNIVRMLRKQTGAA